MISAIGNWFNWFGAWFNNNIDYIFILYCIYMIYESYMWDKEKTKLNQQIKKLKADVDFFKTISTDEELADSYRKLNQSLEEYELMKRIKRIVGEIYG